MEEPRLPHYKMIINRKTDTSYSTVIMVNLENDDVQIFKEVEVLK